MQSICIIRSSSVLTSVLDQPGQLSSVGSNCGIWSSDRLFRWFESTKYPLNGDSQFIVWCALPCPIMSGWERSNVNQTTNGAYRIPGATVFTVLTGAMEQLKLCISHPFLDLKLKSRSTFYTLYSKFVASFNRYRWKKSTSCDYNSSDQTSAVTTEAINLHRLLQNDTAQEPSICKRDFYVSYI